MMIPYDRLNHHADAHGAIDDQFIHRPRRPLHDVGFSVF